MNQKDKNKILKLLRENMGIEANEYMETINIFHCDIISTARHLAEIIYRNNAFDRKHEKFVYRIITEDLIHFFIIYEDKNIYYICKDKDNCVIKDIRINRLRKSIYVKIWQVLNKNVKLIISFYLGVYMR